MSNKNISNIFKKRETYFPSSSYSWYSSVNLVQVVEAMLRWAGDQLGKRFDALHKSFSLCVCVCSKVPLVAFSGGQNKSKPKEIFLERLLKTRYNLGVAPPGSPRFTPGVDRNVATCCCVCLRAQTLGLVDRSQDTRDGDGSQIRCPDFKIKLQLTRLNYLSDISGVVMCIRSILRGNLKYWKCFRYNC